MKLDRLLPRALVASSFFILAACGSDTTGTQANGPQASGPDAPPAPPGGGGPDEAPPRGTLALTFDPDVVRVRRGESLDVTVHVDRAGREGSVTIEALDLPGGVDADEVTLAPEAKQATLRIHANEAAVLGGPRAFRVRGEVAGEAAEASGRVVVPGASGTLDTTFGEDGVRVLQVTDREYDAARDVTVDEEGRILLAGVGQGADPWLGFLVRLAPDGALDTSFGEAGKVLGLPGIEGTDFLGVLSRPDGRIVVATMENLGVDSSSGLRRFQPNGAFDAAFGAEGSVPSHMTRALAAGGSGFFIGGEDFLAAHDDEGALVSSFGGGGKIDLAARAVTVDSSGRIVACGLGEDALEVRRLLPTGAPDATFGEAGLARFPFVLPEKNARCTRMLVQADGRITVSGYAEIGGLTDVRGFIVRFLPDGAIDTSFGEAGARRWGGPATRGHFLRAALDGDERLVVMGFSQSAPSSYFLARYDGKGDLDPSFALGGLRLDLPVERAFAMHLDRVAGRVVVAGNMDAPAELRVARIWL